MPNPELSRRALLKMAAQAGAVLALPAIVPGKVLGKDGAVPPSEKIVAGGIGLRGRGMGDLQWMMGQPDVQFVAICDLQKKQRLAVKSFVDGQYGSKDCQMYPEIRAFLAERTDIDAVLIATGDRWHALATVLAAKAGKDVYCEKPVSLTIHEARAMVEAIRRYGRVFQSGLQQRSSAEFIRACNLVLRGALGKIQMVYVIFAGTSADVCLPAEPVPDGLDWDLWLGPAPWRPFNHRFHHYGQPKFVVPWHFCRDFGGGNLTSNTVHAFDVVQWALGMDESGPVEIIPPETKQVPCLTYKYANGTLLQVVEGRLERQKHVLPKGWDEKTRIENFGAVYVGERGWIHVGRFGYLRAYPPEILKESADWMDHGRAVNDHHQNWLDCIRSRRRPACDVAIGARSTMVAHLGCIAHWTGRALKWDPASEVFLGDDDANRWIRRAMRPPWTL